MTAAKLLTGLVALSLAIVAVPIALGAERPDDRAGPRGVGAVTQPATSVVIMGSPDRIEERLQAGLDVYGRPVRSPMPVDDPADRPVSGGPVAVATESQAGATAGDILMVAGVAAMAAAVVVLVAVAVAHTHHAGPGRPTTVH